MKILKLIKSEFIKIFARKSTLVILILATLFVVFCFSASKIFERIDDYDFYADMAKWEIETLDEVIKENKNKNDNVSKLVIEMAEYKKDLLNEVKKMNIIKNEWKNEVKDSYEQEKANKLLLGLLKKGYKIADIKKANEMMYDAYVFDEEIIVNYETKTEKELKEYESSIDSKINELGELLLGNKTYADYLKREIKDCNNTIEANKKIINENNQAMSKKISNEKKENLKKENETLELNNDRLNQFIYWEQYMIDNKITQENWQYDVIKEIIEYYNTSYKNFKQYTEEEYYKSDEYTQYKSQKLDISYDDYLKLTQDEYKISHDNFLRNTYAVKNNINIVSDTKIQLENSELVYLTVGIVTIIIAGLSLAREFSTGSIRMLLIRPVKRWKILASKLIATVIFMIILTIILLIVSIITTGVCYGFKDILTPEIIVQNNQIVEKPFLLELLKIYSISMVPILFFVILAFAISTIIRSSAAAISLPIAGMFGGQIVQSLFYMSPKTWMAYTPIPYISLSSLIRNGEFAQMLNQINITYNLNISVLNGILMYVILALVILPITFIVFNKIDVKNQ